MTVRKRILVVDDDPLNVEIVRELLEEDYDLLAAEDGKEALEKAKEHHPDLVLLDIMMPGMSGIEACRRIKEDPSLSGVKVILVSAKAMVQERLEGYQAGADDYITKPFDHEEFKAKIRVFLRMKTLEEVDSLKTRILGLLAHETNTPLTSIIFNAEVLAGDQEVDEASRKELSRAILDNAWRLHDFLTKARLLCRFKEGEIRIDRDRRDLGAHLAKIIEEEKEKASREGVRLEADVRGNIHYPISEKYFRLVPASILENLLDTAGEGDEIRLTLERNREGITLCFEDRGNWSKSIPWTDPFEVLEIPDLDHHSRYLGLSLALSKAVVEAHGGKISLESGEGERTVFKVFLPLEEEGSAAETRKESLSPG